MPTRQCPHMITDPIQIIHKRPHLRPRIVHIFPPRRLSSWHIPRELETLHREYNRRFRLVPEHAGLRGESFQLNQEYRWEARDGQGFSSSSRDFTAGAVPAHQRPNQSYVGGE